MSNLEFGSSNKISMEIHDLYQSMYSENLTESAEAFSEETKAQRDARLAARWARVKEMEDAGEVMTSSKRASQKAKARREEKKAEALEKAADSIIAKETGRPSRRSERAMGTTAPTPKEDAPEATRRLHPRLRKDTLGSTANKLLKSIRSEDYEDILAHLIDSEFAECVEDASVIAENMSIDWAIEILEEAKSCSDKPKLSKKAKTKAKMLLAKLQGEGEAAKYLKKNPTSFGEDFDSWVEELLDEGYDLSEYTWDELYEGYKKLPVGKMIKQAAKKGYLGWIDDNKDTNKMARVASRHSVIKGKGKVRGQGQAELNRRRGEMKEDFDFYDVVLSYLLDEGYAASVEEADTIVEGMSDEWLDLIVERSEYGDAAIDRDPLAKLRPDKAGHEYLKAHPYKSTRFVGDGTRGGPEKNPKYMSFHHKYKGKIYSPDSEEDDAPKVRKITTEKRPSTKKLVKVDGKWKRD